MHMKEKDVFRFVKELSSINWSHHNIGVLDEFSFDSRGMIRKRGYSFKGKTCNSSVLPIFFNSIEFLFGCIKHSFQWHYVESSNPTLRPFVAETFRRFKKFDMARVCEHCG
ncbi:hypothetical protein JG688_00005780 [Phytophthora aleatoria]|uniref:Uncharacterized protein n=1 Tax=Phytophthora aleatoria TaxID=2496075 RepID=A0A8J5J938_9STRA|nr:hypothetical protein JG688_00005780 [Phytophthora aleatoria]